MNVDAFKHDDWSQNTVGRWSLLTWCCLAGMLANEIQFDGRPYLSQIIVTSRRGHSGYWSRASDRRRAGVYLSKRIASEHGYVESLCTNMIRGGEKVRSLLGQYQEEIMTRLQFDMLLHAISRYYAGHIAVKYSIEYVPADAAPAVLPLFQQSLLRVEPIFREIEDFLEEQGRKMEEREGISKELILSMSDAEMRNYLDGKATFAVAILNDRFENSVALFEGGQSSIFTGSEAVSVERALLDIPAGTKDGIVGIIAYKGRITGKARIVLNPSECSDFKAGDVLITGMTRPEFLPLIAKASAIVTDAGTLLSHAAIIARELKKPCIIGTKHATKVLKDGDMVEVDAEKGIVRKL